MARDPLAFVADAPLFVVPHVLERLRAYRDGLRPADLPADLPGERLAAVLDDLATRLLAGVEAHPTRFWVMKQFQQSLETVKDDAPAAREHFRGELERLMAILGIERSDWLLEHYLGRT